MEGVAIVNSFTDLSAFIQKAFFNYDVIVVEGLHLAGKTTLMNKLQKIDTGLDSMKVYSSWLTYGGRKSLMVDARGKAGKVYGEIPLSCAYIFAVDVAKQISGPVPVLFDRGFLSTLYYAPDEWSDLAFEIVCSNARVLTIYVRPTFNRHFERVVLSEGSNQMRQINLENYDAEELKYRMLVTDTLARFNQDLIIYNNHFDDAQR